MKAVLRGGESRRKRPEIKLQRQPAGGCSPIRTKECQPMLDVFMLVIGMGFFAAAVAYAFACDRL
jgi:hypothetical protein